MYYQVSWLVFWSQQILILQKFSTGVKTFSLVLMSGRFFKFNIQWNERYSIRFVPVKISALKNDFLLRFWLFKTKSRVNLERTNYEIKETNWTTWFLKNEHLCHWRTCFLQFKWLYRLSRAWNWYFWWMERKGTKKNRFLSHRTWWWTMVACNTGRSPLYFIWHQSLPWWLVDSGL